MKPVKPVTPAKPSATTKPVTPTNPDSARRILKTATCPSLSGKSKLTYQIALEGSSDPQFRITANSSTGFWSRDWISLSEILELLDKVPNDKPITSFVLVPLFRGKSMNTPGFLFAALKQEGLVQGSKDKQRCYERGDPKAFMASVKALSDLTGDAKAKPQKVEDKPKQATPSKPAALAKKTAQSPKKAPAKSSAKKKA